MSQLYALFCRTHELSFPLTGSCPKCKPKTKHVDLTQRMVSVEKDLLELECRVDEITTSLRKLDFLLKALPLPGSDRVRKTKRRKKR